MTEDWKLVWAIVAVIEAGIILVMIFSRKDW